MRRRAIPTLAVTCALALLGARSAHAAPRVTFYDDGVKLHGELGRTVDGAFPEGAIELVALPGETLGLQALVDSDAEPVEALTATVRAPAGVALSVASYSDWFVPVPRPSGNEKEPGSLAFTAEAAPPKDAFVGLVADALVPRPLDLPARARGALWIDVRVSESAPAGRYVATLVLVGKGGSVLEQPLTLEIGAAKMPYQAAKVAVFYDPETLDKRMRDRAAEPSLRQVLHAHHVSALPERKRPEDIDLDLLALKGALYTKERGYDGPGLGVGDDVYTIGAYGSLGDPDDAKLQIVERFVSRIESAGPAPGLELFLYAVDEDCKSRRAQRWLSTFERSPRVTAAKVRVGVTCGEPPTGQAATLVMMPSNRYDRRAADEARAAGKSVWAYNGIRPHAGAMMLDVPATDLRANAWIAMRYGVERWFYWESTYYLDDNRGGQGGPFGWDPYRTAETFHNADGDYAMGDGILVYPGKQASITKLGMVDHGEDAFYPSVRLKNLRRGVLDAGYVSLARARDPDRAEAVVRRMIPRALADARDRAAWPDDAATWRRARADLFAILQGPIVPAGARPARPPEPELDPLPWGRIGAAIAAVLAVLALATRLFRARAER
ncbi:MAG: DUF4091 domain-containing protein [Polyangiaceae bacterium]